MRSTRCLCKLADYRPMAMSGRLRSTLCQPRARLLSWLGSSHQQNHERTGVPLSSPGQAHHTTVNRSQRDKYFLTTPIFYVNAVPHIGHLYTAVVADSVARWHQIRDSAVIFSTGTDEHGLKIQQAAQKQGKDPAEFCDSVSHEFRRLFDLAGIGHTDYIRTTEDRHVATVQHFWRTLEATGHIYRGSYEGWYCMADEAFLSEDDVTKVQDPSGNVSQVSVESGQPVEWVKEENYMFRLSRFTSQLKAWLESGVIQPSKFVPLVTAWLQDGLEDLSVSRHSERLHWGIPVPGDETQTVYVWLDALVNYLTVAGYPDSHMVWPPDCHVIGKDILKFHAVYWPAFLMAVGLDLPKSILVHSHWMVDSHKMSKSRGNVVDPYKRLDLFTADGFRYFLLREGVPHSDGNYSDERVMECINSELVNTLGNLLGRCTGRAINSRQVAPRLDLDLFHQRASESDKTMLNKLLVLPDIVDEFYQNFHVYKGLEAIMSQLHATNAFVQHHQPWVLAKETDQSEWLHVVLAVTMETLRVAGVLLQPAVPRLAGTLLTRLNVSKDRRNWTSLQTFPGSDCDRTLGPIDGLLFPRIKMPPPQ